MNEYAVVRRLKDGAEMAIPLKHVQKTLRQGFELVREVDELYRDAAVEPPPEPPENECPLCGLIAKSAQGLKVHKKAKHV